TLPIFAGGAIKGIADWNRSRKGESEEDAELGKGSLFATGLVAGGALFGVIVAIATVFAEDFMKSINMESTFSGILGHAGYEVFGVICFAIMGITLYRVAMKK
ncbi:MAG TPA: peptide transporter, partial [bacterium]|nr:peptide transporter [bacterium]